MGAVVRSLIASAAGEGAARETPMTSKSPTAARYLRIALPLVLFVALHAEVHLEVVVGEALELRPVRPMTARAVNGDVPVPLVDHFFADRMRGVLLPFVAGPAEVEQTRVVEQENAVG